MYSTAVQSAPAETSSPKTRHTYRPDIDGLRALAILSVVLHHAGVPFIPGGFTGVDIFFVISGYLIGGQIYADIRSGSFSYLRFYQRRARRILPAFYIVLLFTIAAALVLLSPSEARTFARDAFAATLSASNISFWHFASYFDPSSSLKPLLMTWSLGVEEQFYLVIPLLFVLLARLRPRTVLPAVLFVCFLSLLLAARDVSIVPMQAFYLLPDRAWELGIGVALAVFERDRRPLRLSPPLTNLAAFVGLALILAPFVLLTPHSSFPGFAALPSVLGTAILIALPTSFLNRRLLALAPLVFIGRVSYSWYLWHWPLLAYLRVATANSLSLPAALLAVTLAFILAVLSWRFIEQPFRHSTMSPAPLLLRYAAASVALLAVCAALYVAHGLPQRLPHLATMEAPADILFADPCLDGANDEPNLSPGCYPSPASTLPSIALWGDSHALALAPAMRVLANARGYGFAELVRSSCTPLIGATHLLPRVPNFAARCERFNRATFIRIQSDPRIRIVVLTASWSAPLIRNWKDGWLAPVPGIESTPASASTSASNATHASPANPSLLSNLIHPPPVPTAEANLRLYQSALDATVRALQSAGKQVILVQDTPSFAVDPLLAVRSAQIPTRRALDRILNPARSADPSTPSDPGFFPPESSPEISASQSLLQQASQQLPAQIPDHLPPQVFDPKPAFCPTPTQCAYRAGDTMLYVDSTHLSAAGAARALTTFPLPAYSIAHMQKSARRGGRSLNWLVAYTRSRASVAR
jgi:peptidoglycan/LPS O-acetylase OafA/YrhL